MEQHTHGPNPARLLCYKFTFGLFLFRKLWKQGYPAESDQVWSSDNGGAVEATTGMKNSYPLRGGDQHSSSHSF
jgi:hypothetical protein